MQAEAPGDILRSVAEVFGPCGAATSWDCFAPQPLFPSEGSDRVQLLEAVAPGLVRGLQLLAQHPDGPIVGLQQQPSAAATLLLLLSSVESCFSFPSGLDEQLRCQLAVVATRAGILPALSGLCSELANGINAPAAADATAAQGAALGSDVVALVVTQLGFFFQMIAVAWPGGKVFGSPALEAAVPPVASLLAAALRNNAACVPGQHGMGTADVAFRLAWSMARTLPSLDQSSFTGPEALLLQMALGLAAQRLHQDQHGWPAASSAAVVAGGSAGSSSQQQQQSTLVPAHHQRLLQELGVADGVQCSRLAALPDRVADIMLQLWCLYPDDCPPPRRYFGRSSGGGIDYAEALAEEQQHQVWASACTAAFNRVMVALPVVMEVMALQPTPKMVGAGLATLGMWSSGAGGLPMLAGMPPGAASELLLQLLQLVPPAVAQAQHATALAPAAAAAAAQAAAADAAAAAPAAADAAVAAPAADAADSDSIGAPMNSVAMCLAGAAVSGAVDRGQGLHVVAAALRQVQQQCSAAFEAFLRSRKRHSSADASTWEPISFFIQHGSVFDLQLFSLMISCQKGVARAVDAAGNSSGSDGSDGFEAQQIIGILRAVFNSCRMHTGSTSMAGAGGSSDSRAGDSSHGQLVLPANVSSASSPGWLPVVLAARCCVSLAAVMQQQSPAADRDTCELAAAVVTWLSRQVPAAMAAEAAAAAATAVQTGPSLQQLLQEQGLPMLKRLEAIGSGLFATDGPQLQEVIQMWTWRQLEAFGAAVAAQLPQKHCCNFHGCINIAKESELDLVSGRACVCSGCNTARYCSRECQVAHYKGWHKAVCRHIASQRQQQQQQQQQQE